MLVLDTRRLLLEKMGFLYHEGKSKDIYLKDGIHEQNNFNMLLERKQQRVEIKHHVKQI